jgi:hypothetical protein
VDAKGIPRFRNKFQGVPSTEVITGISRLLMLNDAGEIQIQQRRKLIVRSAFICGVELTPFATNTCCRLPKKKANRENFIVIVFCENNPSKIDLDFYGISLRRRSVTNVTNVTNLTFYLISEI